MLPLRPAAERRSLFARRGRWAPWTISLALHLCVLLALGLLTGVHHGTGAAVTSLVTIVSGGTGDGKFYGESSGDGEGTGESVGIQAGEPGGDGSGSSGGGLGDLLGEGPPVDPTGSLPGKSAGIGGGGGVGTGAGLGTGAGGFLGNVRQGGTGGAGRARVTVFGVRGEGYKFLFVFDRSGSMGGGGDSPLMAAKSELKSSLAVLEENHLFQIIFYNERPTMFPLAGRAGRLVFGTDANKAAAARFIDGMAADGGTRHEDALLDALKLAPDVVFFLTDADQPELSNGQLERIHQRNYGAVINTIEFGLGPSFNEENFLVKLAKQNGGEYTYFDVTSLRHAK